MDAKTLSLRALLPLLALSVLAATPPARAEEAFVLTSFAASQDAPWVRFFPDQAEGLTLASAAVPLPEGPPARLPSSIVIPRAVYAAPADDRPRWTKGDTALAVSYVLLSAADAWQTANMPPGYAEGNPVLSSVVGKNPSLGEVAAVKAVLGTGVLWASRRAGPGVRKTSLWLATLLQLAVVVHNERTTGGILTNR